MGNETCKYLLRNGDWTKNENVPCVTNENTSKMTTNDQLIVPDPPSKPFETTSGLQTRYAKPGRLSSKTILNVKQKR